MWIKHVQHARDGAVVDRLIGIHRISVVPLDYGQDVREALHRILGVVGASCRGPRLRSVDEAAQQRRYRQHDNKQNDTARLGFLVLWPVNCAIRR